MTITLYPWMLWVIPLLAVMSLIIAAIKCNASSDEKASLGVGGSMGVLIITLVIYMICFAPTGQEMQDAKLKEIMPVEWCNLCTEIQKHRSLILKENAINEFIKTNPPKITETGLDSFLYSTGLIDAVLPRELLNYIESSQ